MTRPFRWFEAMCISMAPGGAISRGYGRTPRPLFGTKSSATNSGPPSTANPCKRSSNDIASVNGPRVFWVSVVTVICI